MKKKAKVSKIVRAMSKTTVTSKFKELLEHCRALLLLLDFEWKSIKSPSCDNHMLIRIYIYCIHYFVKILNHTSCY